MQRCNSGADLQSCNDATLECVVFSFLSVFLGVNCLPIFVMFEWVFWVSFLSGFLGVIFVRRKSARAMTRARVRTTAGATIEKQTN